MDVLSAAELLATWERAQGKPAVQRAVEIVAALRGTDREEVELLPLGERDRQLLTLFRQIFGGQIEGLADCPQCKAPVEFSALATALYLDASDRSGPLNANSAGFAVSFRLPNSADLAAVATESEAASARLKLFHRCVLAACHVDGRSAPMEELPEELISLVADQMGKSDPQADIVFVLHCPSCEASWHAPFDIASFFLSHLHAWAKRLLLEVHEIASSYGWSEAEILALSPVRRRAYLDLLRP